MALDDTTHTWLETTHQQEQLDGLDVAAQLNKVLEAGKEALLRMGSHTATRLRLHTETEQYDRLLGHLVAGHPHNFGTLCRWAKDHFASIDPQFEAALDEMEEEKRREQEQAQALLEASLV